MTMFLIQSLLLLLAAFLLGYGIGRWVKGLVCKRQQAEVQTRPSPEPSHLRVPVTSAAVATSTAATAALARSSQTPKPTVTVKQPEVAKPTVTVKTPELKADVTPIKVAELKTPEPSVALPVVDMQAPKLDLPTATVAAPKVDVDLPQVDVKAPVVDLPKVDVNVPSIDLPEGNIKAPSIDLPKVDVDVPSIDLTQVELKTPTVDVPKVDIQAPKIDVPKVDLQAPAVDLPKVDLEAPTIDLPKVDLEAPAVDVPKFDLEAPTIDLPNVDVQAPSVNLPKVDLQAPAIDLPTVDVSTPSIELPKVDVPSVDLPKVEVTTPTLAASLPTIDAKLPDVEVDAPHIEVKDITTGIVGLGAVAASVAALKLNAPDGEFDMTVSELIKPPEADVDLKTLQMNLPSSKADVSAVEWHNKEASADIAVVNVPEVQIDLPEANLPKMDVDLAAANLHTPEGETDLTALRVDVPDTAIHLPEAGIDFEHAKLGAGAVELNTPEGLYTLEGAKVQALDQAEAAVAVRLTKPDGDVQVASFTTDASGQVNVAAVDNSPSGVELQSFELGSLQSGLVNQDWLASLKASALEQGNTILAGAADQALTTQAATQLTTTEIGGLGAGLSPEWLAGLKQAAMGAGLGAVVAKATDSLAGLPKPVDESDSIEGLKTLADDSGRANDLVETEIGVPSQGLNPAFLGSLKTASANASTEPVNVITHAAEQIAGLPKSVDESDLIENVKNAEQDLERDTALTSTDLGLAGQGLNTDFLAGLKTAAAGLGTAAAVKVANDIVDLPEPVDESDVIEDVKTIKEDLARNADLNLVTVDRAALNPSNLTVTEIATVGQGLHADALSGLQLDAASTETLAAVQANLDSGVQPMIVDESDVIEAIKLAWDGDLSPAELAALQNTLILRPGETGRLGLVTCSVPTANCVSLGGLEGDLSAGDAMRSKLFNMAVTHNDDGNYVFSSLSAWVPEWQKSGDTVEHTDEQAQLVWDNDPSAVDYAAGYQLTLHEGQYGNLGTVSCAVNEPGSVSLGGIVGSVADGQTAVSKLYGIFIERAGDVYTFKQFSKPNSNDSSWGDAAKAAAVAMGAGVAAQASGAVDAINDMVMPVTKSETTDMLEPDLDWSDDKIRVGVHRLIAESHDRRGSKLVSQLWDSDSGYDCGFIEGEESLILKPGLYGKLGSIHCGVTKPGRVVVSGDVSALAEGEGVLFHLYNIVVCRDDEDNYRFERLNDLV